MHTLPTAGVRLERVDVATEAWVDVPVDVTAGASPDGAPWALAGALWLLARRRLGFGRRAERLTAKPPPPRF